MLADALIGTHDESPSKVTVLGHPPLFLGPLSHLVSLRGGEYVVPSINGLHLIAAAA
jgi:hypothetical protein